MDSRKAVEIPFLKEAPISEILGAKLPTGMTIFRHFWYHHKVLGKSRAVAERDAAKAVISFWNSAGMEVKKVDYISRDINKWFNAYQVKSIFNKNEPLSWKSQTVYLMEKYEFSNYIKRSSFIVL